MKRETISKALNGLDDRFISESAVFSPDTMQGSPERIVHMKKKRIVSLALAAALILALGVTAYAVWNIHSARQQEIKTNLKIEENNVSSYVEYDVTEEQENKLVLLSAVNDGDLQRVYVNISPVSEEDAAGFPERTWFSWSFDGTDIGGLADPKTPSELTLTGQDQIREAVLKYSYDEETKTLTVECLLEKSFIEKAESSLGTDELPLQVNMIVKDKEIQTFGPISFVPTETQIRSFDFSHAVYHDSILEKDIEIVGLELTPFSAVWKVRYEGAESFHTPEADWEKYAPWSALEDKVGMESLLVFSDGSSFSTGGALTTPCNNGVVELHCGWGSAINIDDVQRIVLDDLVLWENK